MAGSMTLEHVGAGVKRQWLYDRYVLFFLVSDLSKVTVDTWVGAYRHALETWPDSRPLLVATESENPREHGVLNPYLGQRLKELSQIRSEVEGRVAFVVQPVALAKIVKLFMRSLPLSDIKRDVRLFYYREDALGWLSEMVPPSNR